VTREELEREVDRVLLKQAAGEKLTKREEKILAYGYYAASCASCGGRHNRGMSVRISEC
jgi:hypothetical protein